MHENGLIIFSHSIMVSNLDVYKNIYGPLVLVNVYLDASKDTRQIL